MKRILWYLIAGTKGGVNRAKIINSLHDQPYNLNQLSKVLDVDYRTIMHHIKILKENQVVLSVGKKYGALYYLTDQMEENYNEFKKIWDKIKDK
ncbi:MAG: winged helix-turn-helix domain-containing protein [Methanobacteriaceae archaeon]|nr:winged helix-turn-helix domain-containing protein [Methanobacteriaceae archaeon]